MKPVGLSLHLVTWRLLKTSLISKRCYSNENKDTSVEMSTFSKTLKSELSSLSISNPTSLIEISRLALVPSYSTKKYATKNLRGFQSSIIIVITSNGYLQFSGFGIGNAFLHQSYTCGDWNTPGKAVSPPCLLAILSKPHISHAVAVVSRLESILGCTGLQ